MPAAEKVLKKQDFEIFEGSLLSQDLALPALNPTNFVVSRREPSVVFVGTLGTFHSWGNNSHLPDAVVKAEKKKRGFDSQLVLQKLRLTKDKDLVA